MKKVFLLLIICSISLFAKNILILNSYHPSFSWTKVQVDGIINTLSNNSQIDLYLEYMDTKRNKPTDSYKLKLLTLLKYKYINKKIDIVIATDDNALRFLMEHRSEIFAKSKIVFSGVNNIQILDNYTKNDISGVFEKTTPYKNYLLAKKLHPDIKKLYLLGDDSVTYKVLKKIFIEELKGIDIEFEFISRKKIDDLTKELGSLEKDSMAMFVMVASYVDENGENISMESAISKINEAYAYPIISTAKIFNHGGKIIGGYVVDGNKQGRLAAKLALKILNNPLHEVPEPILHGTNSYVFDYKALKYFGINLNKIDFQNEDVTINNQPLSFYEHNKELVIIFIIIIVALIIVFIISIIYAHRMKNINSRLKRSNKNIKLFMDSILEGVLITRNGYCIDVNQEAVKLLHYENKDELIGKKLVDFVSEKQRDYIMDERVNLDIARPEEITFIKKDGEEFDVLATGKNLVLDDGVVRVSSFVDLTESKQKDKILFEQGKLASMGEMIGNIAHQWRQPLSAISTAASGVKLQKELNILDDSLLHDSLDVILKSTNYLSQTIDDFKNYIRGNKTIETFKVAFPIENTFQLLNASIRNHRINIIKNIEDVEITSCSNEIIQVLINIINNSKDALIENVEESKRIILVNAKSNDNNILIDITDNAGGIPEKIIDKIFEPYFTTKEKTQGTGLGLYMSYNLITESLDGTIEASNKEFIYNNETYKGVTMNIILPKYIEKNR